MPATRCAADAARAPFRLIEERRRGYRDARGDDGWRPIAAASARRRRMPIFGKVPDSRRFFDDGAYKCRPLRCPKMSRLTGRQIIEERRHYIRARGYRDADYGAATISLASFGLHHCAVILAGRSAGRCRDERTAGVFLWRAGVIVISFDGGLRDHSGADASVGKPPSFRGGTRTRHDISARKCCCFRSAFSHISMI